MDLAKLMIASDIHGSAYFCKELMKAYDREKADKLILLGDLLYHGPRNDLPKAYAPKEVAAILNERKEELLCVAGNCEAPVDQMMLGFPVLADYGILYIEKRMVFFTHGHIHNREQLPMLKKGDILLHGHTHIPALEDCGDYIYLNPGSTSIPKEGNPNSYMIYEKGVFTLKTINGEPLRSLSIEVR